MACITTFSVLYASEKGVDVKGESALDVKEIDNPTNNRNNKGLFINEHLNKYKNNTKFR
jgi:hypothetical protein